MSLVAFWLYMGSSGGVESGQTLYNSGVTMLQLRLLFFGADVVICCNIFPNFCLSQQVAILVFQFLSACTIRILRNMREKMVFSSFLVCWVVEAEEEVFLENFIDHFCPTSIS